MGGSSSSSPSEAKDETKSPRKSPKAPSRFASVSASSHSKVHQKVMQKLALCQEYTGIQKWTCTGDRLRNIAQPGNGADWFLILCKDRNEDIAFMSSHPNVYDWGRDAQIEMLEKNNYQKVTEILVEVSHTDVKEQLKKDYEVGSTGEMFLSAFATLKQDKKMMTLLRNIATHAPGKEYEGIYQYRLKEGDPRRKHDVFIISTIPKQTADQYDLKFTKIDQEVVRINKTNRADSLVGYEDEPFEKVEHKVTHFQWASLCLQMKDSIGTNISVEEILYGAWQQLESDSKRTERLDSCGSMNSISAENVYINQHNIEKAEHVITGGSNMIQTPSSGSDSDDVDAEIAKMDDAIARYNTTESLKT